MKFSPTPLPCPLRAGQFEFVCVCVCIFGISLVLKKIILNKCLNLLRANDVIKIYRLGGGGIEHIEFIFLYRFDHKSIIVALQEGEEDENGV